MIRSTDIFGVTDQAIEFQNSLVKDIYDFLIHKPHGLVYKTLALLGYSLFLLYHITIPVTGSTLKHPNIKAPIKY